MAKDGSTAVRARGLPAVTVSHAACSKEGETAEAATL